MAGELAGGDFTDTTDEDFLDLGECPYYARWCSVEGHDPEATCTFGCVDEPECVTCRPSEGWAIEKEWANAR